MLASVGNLMNLGRGSSAPSWTPVLSLRHGVAATDDGSGNLAAWGVASAVVGARPTIITTAGAMGYRGNGSSHEMTLPKVTLTAALGWAVLVVCKPNTSHNGGILGAASVSPANEITNRIQGDLNAIQLYTSAGLRAPSLVGQANNNRRIILIMGDSTYWKVWVNGGAGSGGAATIGDFAIETLWRRGAPGGFYNGELNTVLAYSPAPTLAFMNALAATEAAAANYPSTWTTAT